MGSLPSSSRPSENFLCNYHICVVFCPREPTSSGCVTNWIELFNPSINTWTDVGSIPGLMDDQVLKGFSMVFLRDSIYIIGGQVCHKERVHVSDDIADWVDVGVQVVPTVLRYDFQSSQWSSCAPLGVARYDFACTVCEDKIYVAGGKSMLASARGISSAEVYDPNTDTWTTLPNLRILRYKCVGVTWQGKVHVIGGFAEREDSDRTVPSLVERSSGEVYNTKEEKWDLKVGMWQLDVPPNQIVEVNETLLSSGDCLNAWKGQVEAFDGKLWNEVDGSRKQSLSTLEANQRLYLTMAPIRSELYFLAGYGTVGGQEAGRTTSVVHIFDTSATGDAWRSFEPMEVEGERELCGHCCVVQLS
ncbi:F-box/kelch-repeat protein SKIP30-like [Prosopis cineraria]|uniref:F-box/kelch-repeat protein SKIP30-like n=1 Tax=Prosopis cineraria TaxID=364024 RepID=UPI00240F322E|nr:F-box/kelch-repeat protein SKIP30-like [Prosopis cineraria]